MAAAEVPTVVDVAQLTGAVRWLTDLKAYVDKQILTELRTIPGIVGNAPTNPNATTMPTVPATSGMGGGGGAVTGVITEIGATHFGLFPNGRDLAQRHAGAYNNVLMTLTTVSADLGDAIDATEYILANYREREELTAQEINKIITDPPYQPAPPGGRQETSGEGGAFQ